MCHQLLEEKSATTRSMPGPSDSPSHLLHPASCSSNILTYAEEPAIPGAFPGIQQAILLHVSQQQN